MDESLDAHIQSLSENAVDVSGTPRSTISRRDLLRPSGGPHRVGPGRRRALSVLPLGRRLEGASPRLVVELSVRPPSFLTPNDKAFGDEPVVVHNGQRLRWVTPRHGILRPYVQLESVVRYAPGNVRCPM